MAGLLATNLFVRADAPATTTLSVLTTTRIPATTNPPTTNPPLIFIDIKGEVRMPGVYGVTQGVRLYEVILLAGGLTQDADVSLLNQAITVYDAMVVVIPPKSASVVVPQGETMMVEIRGEVLRPGNYRVAVGSTLQDLIRQAGGITIFADLSSFALSGVLAANMVIVIPAKTTSPTETVASDHLININTATLQTLTTLPGIGDILGQRIIDYRAEFGPFETIEEIMNVSGIKTSVYEQIKTRIKV